MNLVGLKLAALYSFGCDRMWLHSSLGSGAEKIISDFLFSAGNRKTDIVRAILEKMEAYDHYQAIARDNGLADPFDRDVVQTYWLGKSFGLRATRFHNEIVLTKLSSFLATGRKDREVIKAALDCLVLAGSVHKVKARNIAVDLTAISFGNGFFEAEMNQDIDGRLLLRTARRGDFVSIHLGRARQKISVAEGAVLGQKTLFLLNSTLGLPSLEGLVLS